MQTISILKHFLVHLLAVHKSFLINITPVEAETTELWFSYVRVTRSFALRLLRDLPMLSVRKGRQWARKIGVRNPVGPKESSASTCQSRLHRAPEAWGDGGRWSRAWGPCQEPGLPTGCRTEGDIAPVPATLHATLGLSHREVCLVPNQIILYPFPPLRPLSIVTCPVVPAGEFLFPSCTHRRILSA